MSILIICNPNPNPNSTPIDLSSTHIFGRLAEIFNTHSDGPSSTRIRTPTLLWNSRASRYAHTPHRERKCADTTGTVLVPWAGRIQCKKCKYIFQIKCTETISSNSTRKLLLFGDAAFPQNSLTHC